MTAIDLPCQQRDISLKELISMVMPYSEKFISEKKLRVKARPQQRMISQSAQYELKGFVFVNLLLKFNMKYELSKYR